MTATQETESALCPTSIREGARCVFRYPPEFTTLPEYTQHAGETVTVTRRLLASEADQEDEAMFEVVAPDGWVGHAHEGELEPCEKPVFMAGFEAGIAKLGSPYESEEIEREVAEQAWSDYVIGRQAHAESAINS